MGKENGRMVGGRYHCIMVRSFDFILGATAAFKEGYSIYIGMASTLHCRRAIIIIIIFTVKKKTWYCGRYHSSTSIY